MGGQDRFGVLIGSGIGGVEFFEDNCGKFNKAGGKAAGLKKARNYYFNMYGSAVCIYV